MHSLNQIKNSWLTVAVQSVYVNRGLFYLSVLSSTQDQISSDSKVSCLILKIHYSHCNCPKYVTALKGHQQTFLWWKPLRIGTPEIYIENPKIFVTVCCVKEAYRMTNSEDPEGAV